MHFASSRAGAYARNQATVNSQVLAVEGSARVALSLRHLCIRPYSGDREHGSD